MSVKPLNRSIVLIGPMGSSKSATARCLSKMFNIAVVDIDREFENRYGVISDFFAAHGESEFRKKETQLLIEKSSVMRTIISTGGGAVLSHEGMCALRRRCDIVYLYADVATLQKRISHSKRPLKNNLESIIKEREPLYNKYADFKIDTTDLSVSETAGAVVAAIDEGRPNRYKAVLIDADNTILDFDDAQRASITELLKDANAFSSQAVSRFEQINTDCWDRYYKSELTIEQLKQLRFELLFSEFNINYDIDKANNLFRQNLVLGKMIDGAVSLLSGLKVRGIKTYVVTNSDAIDVQRKRLEKVNHLLDGIFLSAELEASKPSEEFFNRAHAKIGNIDKSKIIILGDSIIADIEGGKNYGIDTCLFDPTGRVQSKADYSITKLTDFLEIV